MTRLKENHLKIAIPKKGRLRNPAVSILNKAGYTFKDDKKLLHAPCNEADIDFLFLRTEDIPVLIEEGAIDLGITGKDNVLEKQVQISELLPLEYGHCQLALAGPDRTPSPLKEFHKKKVATSFPHLTKEFFLSHGADVRLIEVSGSLEIMVALKLCDAIVDIVQTGSTLMENHLHLYEVVGDYYTALYTREALVEDPRVKLLKKRLTGALLAQNYRMLEYNIQKNNLKQAEAISTGFDSPTLSSLDNPEMVAVKIMVRRSEVIALMDQLEQLGATAIIETEIKNCRL